MTTKRLLAALAPAALLACGVARDLQAVDSAAVACTSCHGDPDRPGSALVKAAPPATARGGAPGAHLVHLDRGVACGACHVVPSSAGHSNDVVEVRLSGLAAAKGATPSFAAGTCSGVYCHGATLGAGGKAGPPAWWGAPLACDACHGAPPPSHAATSTSCHDCHPGTVAADGTIVRGGLHVNGVVEGAGGHPQGWGDPAQHGAAAKGDLASCRACHGQSLDGVGGTGPSCADCHAAAGYAGWQANCTFCHGAKRTTYLPANLASAAPPRGTAGETATTTRAVGAHQRHLTGGAVGGPVACAECHVVPTSLTHLDGSAGVTFGAAAKRDGANPTWNGTSCASTYCHGATVAGGSNKAPTWTASGQAGCGTCHGVPPPAPHTTSTACGSCHTGYSSTAVNAALHLNGTVEATSSHPAGWSAKAQHGYAANRGGLASCKACHGASLDGVGGTGPSCATCHASAGFASWQTSCTFCHGDRTTGLASPPVDTQGGTSTASVSVGVHASHLGTTLMATPACAACHPDRTGSNVIGDAAHVDGNGIAEVAFGALARTGGAPATYTRTSSTAASCASVYCHGRFTGGASSGAGATMSWTSTAQATCTSCHGAPPATGKHSRHSGRSCGDCHPGYTTTAVSRTTHVDGARQVGNRITAWNASTRQCTGCHGVDTW